VESSHRFIERLSDLVIGRQFDRIPEEPAVQCRDDSVTQSLNGAMKRWLDSLPPWQAVDILS